MRTKHKKLFNWWKHCLTYLFQLKMEIWLNQCFLEVFTNIFLSLMLMMGFNVVCFSLFCFSSHCSWLFLFIFLGDRLTDERVNGAQCAMKNENSPTERLEGFISKIEDFHRLMNFLEVCKVFVTFYVGHYYDVSW